MKKEEDSIRIPLWRTKRYQIAALFFLGCVLQATLKFNLSIAIVCMVRHNDYSNDSMVFRNSSDYVPETIYNLTKTHTEGCGDLHLNYNSSVINNEQGEFWWSKELQGLLLGGMFWGFLSGQILCGWLGQNYGARTVIGLGIGAGALLTLLSPVTARISPYLFLAVRISIGLALACVYPNLVGFWTRWAPPAEYSRMMGLSLSGSTLGNAIVFPIGGLLCGSDVNLGWSSVFYFTGGLTACWAVIWMLFVRDTPGNTPGISQAEKEFLEQCLHNRGYRKRLESTPWLKMLTTRPVIALIITHILGNYCLYMLFTLIPTYLHEILKVDIRSNGVYSMLPLVCMSIVTNVCGQTADFLIYRHICTVSTTRKIFNTIGCVVPGAFMVGLGFLGCDDRVLALTILCLASGFVGFNFSGHIINYGDIALLYGGTLSGVGNTFSSISGVIAPFVVSSITRNGTQAEWRSAFYVAAGAFGLAALVFGVFGTGKIQPWAISQTGMELEEEIHMDTDRNGEIVTNIELNIDKCNS